MAEYNNKAGWEASQKTRDYWRFIPMKDSSDQGFSMPPLFKGVNPIIRWLVLGFLGIFILEGYATVAVAMSEGVPIEVITLLVFVDIFLACLPHMFDGKRTDLKNFIFIGKYSDEYLSLEDDEKIKYQSSYINNEGKLQTYNIIKAFLYIPILVSAYIKLWLFFSQYPFFNTYQAYIIFVSYGLGCVLHILCTGHVIMYWRFRIALKRDRRRYGSSNGEKNKIKPRPDKWINAHIKLEFNTPEKNLGNQKIVSTEAKFYLHFEGLLFDEEINGLISHQDSLKQKLAVALTGKIIQTKQLTEVENQ